MTASSAVPKKRRTGSTRKYLTVEAERIIGLCWPGQVLAAVIERAVRQMAIRDGLLTAKGGRPTQEGGL